MNKWDYQLVEELRQQTAKAERLQAQIDMAVQVCWQKQKESMEHEAWYKEDTSEVKLDAPVYIKDILRALDRPDNPDAVAMMEQINADRRRRRAGMDQNAEAMKGTET